MTDEEYIIRAVELASGWYFETNTEYRWVEGNGDSLYWHGQWSLIPGWHKQIFLDALAAQLVRQVDALPDQHIEFDIIEDMCATVLCDKIGALSMASGPDRTMNTIKAIVDSGVLDG